MIPRTPKAYLNKALYTKLFRDAIFPEYPLGRASEGWNEFYNELISTYDDITELAYEMINDIQNKYWFYEICDEDDETFWQCILNTFTEFQKYYHDLYITYLKDKDIDTLFTRTSDRKDNTSRWGTEDGTTSASDSGTTSSSGSTSNTKEGSSDRVSSREENTNRDTTHRDYDLPNHSVSASSEDGYLTSKFKEEEDTQHKVDDSNNETHEDTESGTSSASSEVSSNSSATLNTETSGGSEYDSSVSTTDPKDFYKVKKEVLDMIRNIAHEFTDKFEDCFLHVF